MARTQHTMRRMNLRIDQRKLDAAKGVLGSANRDESHFVKPDRLDLGREPNRRVAFGVGHHFCLGASLARLEARIALTTLFRCRPALRLAQPAESLRWRKSLPLRALTALPVIFE
jgi:cytochrome P450